MPELEIKDIGNIAISLAVAVIIATVVSVLLVDFRKLQTDETASMEDNETVVGGSVAFANNSAFQLRQTKLVSGSEVVWNNTLRVNAGGNYSIDYNSGVIRFFNTSPDYLWGANSSESPLINITYQYLIGSAARNSTSKGLESQNTMASFFPIVALIAIGALVVGIVVRYFTRRE